MQTLQAVDIPRTLGALLVGGLVASTFSGVVAVQGFSYFKYYPKDSKGLKLLVASVWFLDMCHTALVGVSLWDYLIDHFGDPSRVDFIPWSLPVTIAFTAILTFLVHCFFVFRIFKLSRNNYYIAAVLGCLACLRLFFASLTTVKMIALRSLEVFVQKYTWSFTSGLALSSFLDVLITACLCYMLMTGRQKNSSINHVLDSLILYAFENGALTCAATIVSMICWLAMPTNLIFMGLHFVISKFYANSLLATLNTRKHSHDRRLSMSCKDRSLPVIFSDTQSANRRISSRPDLVKAEAAKQLQINVEQTTTRTFDYTPSRKSLCSDTTTAC